MTDFEPGDPIGSWLGSEVELLPPKPGGFQKVRRRARRRKAAQAISMGAGALVAIAAIVTGPQIASTLLQQAGPAQINGASPPARPSGKGPSVQAPLKSGSPSATGSARPLPPGTPIWPDSGKPVPPGFAPESVTFVGPNTGAVLGQVGPACQGACAALAGTSDYGRSWYAFSAPKAGGPAGDTGVSAVRFLNNYDGWVYGPELYATHDGGANWKKITPPVSGRVIDLATVSDRAFAVVASCSGTGAAYAAGCTSFQLITTAAGSDSWAPVAGVSGTGPVVPGGLELNQSTGYLIVSGALYSGPVAGGPWQRATAAAGAPPCLTGTGGAPGLLATGTGKLYLACGGTSGGSLALYVTADSARTWTSLGAIPAAGQATSLAVAPPPAGSQADSGIVLATSQGLYYSAGFKTWRTAAVTGGVPAGGFGYVGMTTGTEGVAVPVSGQAHELFTTSDGGLHWTASVIG